MTTTLAFGELLRQLRLAANVSRETLAQRSGLSVKAIGALERGERTHPHPVTVELLSQALGVAPSERAALVAAARSATRPRRLAEAPAPARLRLPIPPTPLIGREADVAHVSTVLTPAEAGARLVTLVGPGGVGKTRLALAIAVQVGPRYRDGAVFVDLAPLHDARLVPSAIARALEVREAGGRAEDLLLENLRERQTLLVLDNFEHLLGAAPLVADLLAGCAELRVLATSRSALRLRAEHRVAVAPLAIAEATQPLDTIAAAPAVQLFVERARAALAEFALTATNAADVARICRHLDGLPLAIELAAARMGLLQPSVLLRRLERRLAGLPIGPADLPERQRTLQTTLAWSHDLLERADQRLFRRLAVFAGGWTVEAMQAICSDGPGDDVLEELTKLVEHSLARPELAPPTTEADVPEEPRFGMLETIRAYANERLEESGEQGTLRRRHAEYYLDLLETAAPRARSLILPGFMEMEPVPWPAPLEAEFDNLREALRWAYGAGEVDIAQRLAAALWPFWAARGYLPEGRDWMDRLLALPAAGRAADRASALHGAGVLALLDGAYDSAAAWLEESQARFREVGDTRDSALVLRNLGQVERWRGDHDRAAVRLEASLTLCRECGDMRGAAFCLSSLGAMASDRGEYGRAARRYEESLALFRATGDEESTTGVLASLGSVLLGWGEPARATDLFTESLELARRLDNRRAVVIALCNLGMDARQHGDVARATALYSRSVTLAQALADTRLRGRATLGLSDVARDQGDAEAARAWSEESLALFRAVGDRWGMGYSLNNLGLASLAQRDLERAATLCAEALPLLRGDLGGMAEVSTSLGLVAHEQGNNAYAATLFAESLAMYPTTTGGPRWLVAMALEGLAGVAATLPGAPEFAARLLGAAEHLRLRICMPLRPANRAANQRAVSATRAALGEQTFARERAAGGAMPLAQAVAAALAVNRLEQVRGPLTR